MTAPSSTPRTDAVKTNAKSLWEWAEFAATLERELRVATDRLSDSPTWISLDGYDPERPKDGETVLGWWPANLPGYRGGMESVTFGAADEDGRSDTWTNAFGDSADPPDYWARIRGPK